MADARKTETGWFRYLPAGGGDPWGMRVQQNNAGARQIFSPRVTSNGMFAEVWPTAVVIAVTHVGPSFDGGTSEVIQRASSLVHTMEIHTVKSSPRAMWCWPSSQVQRLTVVTLHPCGFPCGSGGSFVPQGVKKWRSCEPILLLHFLRSAMLGNTARRLRAAHPVWAAFTLRQVCFWWPTADLGELGAPMCL